MEQWLNIFAAFIPTDYDGLIFVFTTRGAFGIVELIFELCENLLFRRQPGVPALNRWTAVGPYLSWFRLGRRPSSP